MFEIATAAGVFLLLAALLVFVWNAAGELFEVPKGLPFWRETAWRYGAMMARYPWAPVAIVFASPLIALNIIAGQNGYSGWIEMLRVWLTGS